MTPQTELPTSARAGVRASLISRWGMFQRHRFGQSAVRASVLPFPGTLHVLY